MASTLTLTHPLLAALRASKPAFGAWLTLPGFLAARTAAGASPHLSWVVIDCEHGATPLQPGAAEAVHAIAGLGPAAPSAIVRIPATGACADGSAGWQIKYALDAGAKGVLVPMVSTREQAAAVVAAARFPPEGVRGFGSPFTQQAWGAGVSADAYLAHANRAVLVLVQIETRAGVENLDDILAVDGLDGVFIGPYDLSLSFGFPAPAPDPHPEVDKIIERIRVAAHAKGKKWCAPAPPPPSHCPSDAHTDHEPRRFRVRSAVFCTSGTQAAARAKQGFDMVRSPRRILPPPSSMRRAAVADARARAQINVTSDSSAIKETIAHHLARAAGVAEPVPEEFGY
ncbi:Pyruvate/Phosphoenolpyruvate kinase-like domain-containing protein [Trametes elegans]|nr:Pyruvate/Phosphoenolpyruvate kinase-like domain-containing protein [Trametes elegans]